MECETTVLIATACHSGSFPEAYVRSLIGTFAQLGDKGVGVIWCPLTGSAYIENARSILVYQFLNLTTADYLLWIDDDMAWDYSALLTLLAAKKDVIGAPYMNRHKKAWALSELPGKPIINGVVEVGGCGTGFLLMSRKAVQALSDLATESFRVTVDGKDAQVPMCTPIWIDKARKEFVGEDIGLCRRLAQEIPTHIHIGVAVGHTHRSIEMSDLAEVEARFKHLETLDGIQAR